MKSAAICADRLHRKKNEELCYTSPRLLHLTNSQNRNLTVPLLCKQTFLQYLHPTIGIPFSKSSPHLLVSHWPFFCY